MIRMVVQQITWRLCQHDTKPARAKIAIFYGAFKHDPFTIDGASGFDYHLHQALVQDGFAGHAQEQLDSCANLVREAHFGIHPTGFDSPPIVTSDAATFGNPRLPTSCVVWQPASKMAPLG